jgi:hypothetical protein
MKVCPICQSTYESAVDFCFKDGAPLDDLDDVGAGVRTSETTFDGLSSDDFEHSDAISLSNLPAIADSDLPADLGPRRGEKRARPVDPFASDIYGAPDAEASYRDLPAVSGLDLPMADISASPVPEPEKVVEAAKSKDSAPADAPKEKAKAAPVAKTAPPAKEAAPAKASPKGKKGAPAKAASSPRPKASPKRAPAAPARTGRVAEEESGGGSKLGIILGIACLLLIGFIGFMLMNKGGDTTLETGPPAAASSRSATVPAPTATAVAPPPEATPDPVEASPEEGDGLAEGATPEDGAPMDGDPAGQDGAAPAAAAPTPTAGPTPAARPTPAPVRKSPTPRTSEPPFEVSPTPAPRPAPRPDPTPAPTPRPEPPPRATPTPSPTSSSVLGGGTAANPWGAPVESNGTIAVSTTPAGAKVFVDGTAYGASPVRVEFPLGDHTVRVEAAGYAPKTTSVKLQTTKVVTVDVVLEAKAPAAVGTLNVVTTPTSAMLYLDGVAMGRTPVSVSVTQGVHEFKFQAEGKPPQSIQHKVQINAGETKTKVFQLQ